MRGVSLGVGAWGYFIIKNICLDFKIIVSGLISQSGIFFKIQRRMLNFRITVINVLQIGAPLIRIDNILYNKAWKAAPERCRKALSPKTGKRTGTRTWFSSQRTAVLEHLPAALPRSRVDPPVMANYNRMMLPGRYLYIGINEYQWISMDINGVK